MKLIPKPKLAFPLAFLVLVLCTGCPYEADYPLSGTKIRYNKNLIGEWEYKNTYSLKTISVKINEIDDYNFNFSYNDYDDDYGAGLVKGKGYVVSHSGVQYVVAETEEKKYAIYKLIDVSQSGFDAIPLAEDEIDENKKFSSSTAFTNFVLDNPSLFPRTAAETYKRIAEKKEPSKIILGGGSPLFMDYFTDNRNNWYTNYEFKDSNYIYITKTTEPKEKLHFANRRVLSPFLLPVPYTLPSNYNYSFEIDVQHSQDVFDNTNTPFGVKFAAADWNNTYALHITETGYYRISKHLNGVYSVIVPWTKTSALKSGYQFNNLFIRVKTSLCEIYINNKCVDKISNFVPFGPRTGLEVFNRQTIYFDNLVIREL